MKLRTFIKRINELAPSLEELESFNLNTSYRGNWLIDVISDDFDAYHYTILQMVYCCDTITTFPGLNTFRDIIEIDNYYLFGNNPSSEFVYGLNPITNEIALIDNISHELYQHIAKDDYLFLDALYEYALFLKKELVSEFPIEINERKEVAIRCAQVAGLGDNNDFWIEFIGA